MQSLPAIRNEHLAVAVDPRGAELQSIRTLAGVEYLWQADPRVWGRHAPILFPIVGQVAGGVYRLGTREFKMGQHGFARNSDFILAAKSATHLEFELQSSPATLAGYPFEFMLRVVYRLDGPELTVRYEVFNRDSRFLPFSIGAHPGFSCDWPDGGRLEDYYLEFETNETAPRYFIVDGLLGPRTESVFDGGRTIPLTPVLFQADALVFRDLKSTWIALRNRRSPRSVTVRFAGFPHMGIWSKPGAPYVCIEPWFGHADPAGFAGDFMNKPGIQKLAPGKMFTCEHRITIA